MSLPASQHKLSQNVQRSSPWMSLREDVSPSLVTFSSSSLFTCLFSNSSRSVVLVCAEANISFFSQIREHLLEYAGRSRGDKLASLRSEMEKHDVDLCLVCALDEICWVLNLRGDDIPYNPVFFGWLLVSRHMPPVLYCDVAKIEGDHHAGGAAASANGAGPGPAAQQHANGSTTSPPPLDRLQLKPYAQILPDLKAIRDGPKWRVWCDAGGCPAALYEVMENPLEGIEIPIKNWKGVKNSVELAGMRAAHVRDGAAKTKFLMWLEDQFRPRHGKSGTTILTEVSVATKLEELRRQNERFAGLSFGTISGSGPNGAIIHYHPEGEVPVQRGTLYLVDSGAQYLDGTTDVTRTVYIQPDEDKQRAGDDKLDLLSRDYTLVLQGHIALATAVFPTNTPGAALDVLARLPLWKQGWNYNHGTGHGVGAHLNVHEGPHGIPWLRTSLLKSRPEVLANGLVPGMICSNEPGFYVEGQYGIRIENLVEVVTVEDERSGTSGRSVGSGAGERRAASGTTGGADIGVALPAGSGATGAFSAHSSFPPEEQHPYYKRDLQYCCFRNLTFVPLDKKLIEVAMLTTEERAYVDGYHAECYAKLAPFFAEDKTGNDYHRARLREMCAPLEDASKDDVSRANVAMKRRRVAV